MAINFFDTSALGKHYHPEKGTPKVDLLLGTPGDEHTIFRTTIVEMHSVFAKKVRTGTIAQVDFEKLTRKFRTDCARKRFNVIRLLVAHLKLAEQLIRRLGTTQNLRTLDAMQLAAAIRMNDPADPIRFVCADQALCSIAAMEGLVVINPKFRN